LHIDIKGPTLLRRPFSVHKVSGKQVFILFRIKGVGTDSLSQYKKGETIDIIGPLGNGFQYARRDAQYARRILIAGGMGVAPLMFLAQDIKSKVETGENIIIIGAKNKNEILAEKEFKVLGFKVLVATDDGSKGKKGTTIDVLKNVLKTDKKKLMTNIYACGPNVMFKPLSSLVNKYANIKCKVSFEQFMGCGVGLCYACVIQTKDGYKRVCKDGPVFDIKQVVF